MNKTISDHFCLVDKTLYLSLFPCTYSFSLLYYYYQSQYYAHPRNAFWKIMFTVFNEIYSEDYSAKCELLLKNHIALWDMVHSGNREGSLDSDIKDEL